VAELLRSQSVFPAITLSPDQHATLGALEIARVCGLVSASTRQSVGQMLESMRQASLVDDAQIRTKCSARYGQAIEASFDKTFQITGEHVVMDASKGLVAPRLTGKVRDRYEFDQVLALVTTDRQSGFDRMLALVPFKGAVLNLTSAYWFETTKDIVPNHLISVPHPNVSIVKKCTPFPIEFVVR
jgi:phosphoribosylaminoimidazole-succinocarboxamide synthase